LLQEPGCLVWDGMDSSAFGLRASNFIRDGSAGSVMRTGTGVERWRVIVWLLHVKAHLRLRRPFVYRIERNNPQETSTMPPLAAEYSGGLHAHLVHP
jgi:hypothetical protein